MLSFWLDTACIHHCAHPKQFNSHRKAKLLLVTPQGGDTYARPRSRPTMTATIIPMHAVEMEQLQKRKARKLPRRPLFAENGVGYLPEQIAWQAAAALLCHISRAPTTCASCLPFPFQHTVPCNRKNSRQNSMQFNLTLKKPRGWLWRHSKGSRCALLLTPQLFSLHFFFQHFPQILHGILRTLLWLDWLSCAERAGGKRGAT